MLKFLGKLFKLRKLDPKIANVSQLQKLAKLFSISGSGDLFHTEAEAWYKRIPYPSGMFSRLFCF